MNLNEIFHLIFRTLRITASQMDVLFGAYLLFKNIKFLLPLVKQDAPKTHIMEMVVSKNIK